MKFRGSAVRFVLVSATAPNIDDIANWIGDVDSKKPATVFQVRCILIRLEFGLTSPV
jgi:ATP-dependent DNA helicase HFM1/MER3